MGIFEFLKANPLVWILILIAVAVSVIILFTKYLVIDNWDKIFKKKIDKNAVSKKTENKSENENN
jgi:uncharacterized membrane protein (DUF106 family)